TTKKEIIYIESGSSWDKEDADECIRLNCDDGNVTETPYPHCCLYQNKYVKDGFVRTVKCKQYKCKNGNIEISNDPKCCLDESGLEIVHGTKGDGQCLKIICTNGEAKQEIRQDCCKYNGEYFMDGFIRTDNCNLYTCVKGIFEQEI
ncbi:unnamed protein product, partial [Meganyctiphanes norvegica]